LKKQRIEDKDLDFTIEEELKDKIVEETKETKTKDEGK